MEKDSNTFLEDLLNRDLPKFCPFYFEWKPAKLNSRSLIYQNPLAANCYVIIDFRAHDHYKVSFVHTNQFNGKRTLHRLMGPANYRIRDGKLENISWYLFDKEYSEFEYWLLVCRLFASETEIVLAEDECRYWICNDNNAPFPLRLNLEINDLDKTDDEDRKELGAHLVWDLNGRIVNTDVFWKYWEERGYLNEFFLR